MNDTTRQNIIHYPLCLLLHAVAWLPFWALYAISDFCFGLVYHIARYRRKIVEKNIYESFPEKSDNEKRHIIRQFYRNFTDNFVETIKLLHVSDEEMRRRIVFNNIDEVDRSVAQGRSVIVYAAHYCNWEWLSAITLWTAVGPETTQFGQVYRPLKNEWFNRFFLNLRSRFHSFSYAKNTLLRDLIRVRKSGKVMVNGFIADQHPNSNDQGNVITFLNHDTAMITGPEVIAKKMDMDVMAFSIKKPRRGYYECSIEVITRDPNSCAQYEITNTYASMLEKSIRENPSEWLWTHNRWKNKVTPTNHG